ncbi:hypothetical protein JW848_01305 [Candidatus Bipolaricaulota bacterium]|nr:hypothetical protein [Candidatus Bipolaricaulota bacterium]
MRERKLVLLEHLSACYLAGHGVQLSERPSLAGFAPEKQGILGMDHWAT